MEGRDGDSLMTPFECDGCVFRKIRGMRPVSKRQQDQFLLELIRRANLDAFWSRARSTVAQNLSKTKLMLEFSKNVGLGGPFLSYGPAPCEDHCGYELAVDTLQYSRRPVNMLCLIHKLTPHVSSDRYTGIGYGPQQRQEANI